MSRIFVSYSHIQGAWVQRCLVPVLRAGGAEVLIDWERFKLGTAVVSQMDKAQDDADVQLVCLSTEYLASDYCRRELRRAISRDPKFTKGLDGRIKRGLVLPIRLDDAPWPPEIADPNQTMRVDLPKMTHDPMRQTDIERRLANLAKAPRCGAKTRAGSPCRQAAQSTPLVPGRVARFPRAQKRNSNYEHATARPDRW
jgi:hypothetical protein